MFKIESSLLESHKSEIAEKVTSWVKENYPTRTNSFHKCTRDVTYIIRALSHCLTDGNSKPIEHLSTMFFNRDKLQLTSTYVEIKAYDYLMVVIKETITELNLDAVALLEDAIEKLKAHLSAASANNVQIS